MQSCYIRELQGVESFPMRATPIEINWHPGLSIYASEPFLKTVGDEYGWIGGFDPAGKLRCVLPFTVIRKALFRLVRFRVETIPLDQKLTVAEEKSFLNSVITYLGANRADVIIPASTNTIFRAFPDGASRHHMARLSSIWSNQKKRSGKTLAPVIAARFASR